MNFKKKASAKTISLRSATVFIVAAGTFTIGSTHVSAQVAAKPKRGDALTEVVVTARRRSERLQKVPVSVQVVTGSTIQKLAIVEPNELNKIVPGLTIRLDQPSNPTITLRGIRWVPGSGTPAIPIYLNEIGFDPAQTLQALYDIGQIEVLRGPQGTARGAPSISGAVTITTHKPDLEQVGGYVSAQAGELGHHNTQGAVNFPIIKDVLAVRVAGSFDDTQFNHVHSLNDPSAQYDRTSSARASIKFKPNEDIEINATYQHLDQHFRLYDQVVGSGSPGGIFSAPHYNSPAISASQDLAVENYPDTNALKSDLYTMNATWKVLGQILSYNFGYQSNQATLVSNQDQGNTLIGFTSLGVAVNPLPIKHNFNEVRISSTRGEHKYFDYDIGFYAEQAGGLITDVTQVLLPGSYGNPATSAYSPFLSAAAVNRYQLYARTNVELVTHNRSFYGNTQFHLPYGIELSGGVRFLHDQRPAAITTTTSSAFAAIANPTPIPAYGIPLLPCAYLAALNPALAGATNSSINPGSCDVAVPGGVALNEHFSKTYTPTIYNVSISHSFAPNILGYATVGSSWRAGLPAIANEGLPQNLVFPQPESATSYEVGVKTNWNRWLQINGDVFQIDYENQLNQDVNVSYYDPVAAQVRSTSGQFFSNINARARGFELDVTAAPVDHLTLDLNLTYSNLTSAGGSEPCNDASRPLTAANPINFCVQPKGRVLNSSAPLQGSLYANYVVPMRWGEGYLRAVLNYQDADPNYGASDTRTKAYATADLYAGISNIFGGWQLGVYAKNIFDERAVLQSNSTILTGYEALFGSSGLSHIVTTTPREVGVQLSYTFGSH